MKPASTLPFGQQDNLQRRTSMKSTIKTAIAAGVAMGVMAGAANAQSNYPSQTIEILVGFNPGGPVDILARSVAPFLEKHIGNGATVAVINRPGASSVIASSDAARATPDGHTLIMFSHPALVTTLYGEAEWPYRVSSFDFIGTITSEPHNLFVAADSEFADLGELMDAARADPGGITLGAAGIGGAGHLAMKLFEVEADLEFNYVPAPGAADTVTQVLGGHIHGGYTTISGTLPLVQEGQLRILGTYTAERHPQLPDVPTFREQGVDVLWGAVRGLAAPAGLPDDVRETLNNAVAALMEDPEFLAVAERQGLELEYMDGETFRAMAERQVQTLDQLWETNPWK
jgi:tripartite-type tricarboxylate transporter receptor subunit TctC